MFCPECGQQNTDDSKFCTSCGKPITLLTKIRPSSPSTAPANANADLKESGAVTAMSVIGFVFGLIGMLGSFIPRIGSLAFYIGIPAALISAIALGIAYSQNAKRTFAVVALTISLIGVVISGWQHYSIVSAGQNAERELISSKDLTRGKAESLLRNYHKIIEKPISDKTKIKLTTSARFYPHEEKVSWVDTEQINFLGRLQKAGYVALRYSKFDNGYLVDHYFDVTCTPKLLPYVISQNNGIIELKVADVVFDKITGITKAPMDENGRIVEFTTKTLTNPLCDIFTLSDFERQPRKIEAYFRQYDDGWRLER
jgi:hypothetical protein